MKEDWNDKNSHRKFLNLSITILNIIIYNEVHCNIFYFDLTKKIPSKNYCQKYHLE